MARGPGTRAGLTRAAVVAAAGALVDRDGPGALSMRRVAAALGVAPNALYSHVADKDALVDLLLDVALAAVEVPSGEEPLATVRAIMSRTYDVLLARPGLVTFYLARQGSRGPYAVALGEAVDGALVRHGLAPERAADVRRVLIVQVIGFAAFAVDGEGPLGQDTVRRNFELGLDLLLAGL